MGSSLFGRHYLLSLAYQPLSGIRIPVQNDIFRLLFQVRFNVVIYLQHARIHDTHIQSGIYGMVEKNRVHGLANRIVTPECERQVGDAARSICTRQIRLDPSHSLDEVDSVARVFGNACSDRKDIDIENNILWRDVQSFREQPVSSPADFCFPVKCGCLSLFVDGHHHHCSPESVYFFCLFQERLLALLQAYGVYNAFALSVFQTRDNGVPMRRIDHQRRLRHSRVVGNVSHEFLHAGAAVQHRLIHVYVNDGCAVLYLLSCNLKTCLIVSGCYQPCEFSRARHVRAFSDIREIAVLQVNADCLQSANCQDFAIPFGTIREASWTDALYSLGNRSYMLRRSAAASANYIDNAFFCHCPDGAAHLLRRLIVTSHLIRQTCVRIADDEATGETCHFFHEGSEVLGSE